MTKANDLASLLDANGDVVSSALDNVPASDLVNDITPQLGGNLDLNNNNITGTGDINVTGTISSNKGSAGTLATFTDGVNSNFVVETSSLLTTIGNGGGSAALALKANNTEAMRIDSSGNVGIGTVSPIEKVTASGAIVSTASNSTGSASGANRAILDFTSGGARIGHFRGTTGAGSGYAAFYTDSTERMRIDSSGQLIVGHTGAGSPYFNEGIVLNPAGDSVFHRSGNSVVDFSRQTSDGNIVRFVKDNSVVGSIGVESGKLVVNSQGSNLVFAVGGTTELNLDGTQFYPQTDGGLDLGHPSVRWKDLRLSGGVYLGGTGSANYLDAYEEGSHNVTDLSGAGLSITTNRSYYVKIGSIVNYHVSITVPSNTNGNPLSLSLPFSSNIGSYFAGIGAVGYTTVSSSSYPDLSPAVNNNGTNILFYYGNAFPFTNAAASGHRIDFWVQYQRT